MAELDPWDRQPGETSKAYQAFVTYRDLGHDRTQLLVEKELGKSKALISRWAGAHDWVARAAAWDSIPGKAVAEAYADMARDIAEQHKRLSDKLMARLEDNLELLPKGTDPSMRWSTAQAAAHRSHSFATDLVKPASTATDEINKAIENLLNKLAGE